MTSKLIIFSDGGARGNPGPAAIGILICDAQGETLDEYSEVIGETTNNVAEYSAVIKGLQMAKQFQPREIQYFVDSELVQRQLTGRYKVKTPHIRDLFLKACQERQHYEKVVFTHVPRTHENIRRVDKMVNQALDQAGF